MVKANPIYITGNQRKSSVNKRKYMLHELLQFPFDRCICIHHRNIQARYNDMAFIREEIWFIVNKSSVFFIDVYTKSCEKVKRIAIPEAIKSPLVILHSPPANVLITSSTCHHGNRHPISDNLHDHDDGIYILDYSGKYLNKILNGTYTHICICNDTLYVLTCQGNITLLKLQNYNSYDIILTFRPDVLYNLSYIARIHCNKYGIYVSSYRYVYQFNSKGELTGTFGKNKTYFNINKVPPGVFKNAYLIGTDDKGSLLIADTNSNFIHLYNNNRFWYILKLPGIIHGPNIKIIQDYTGSFWIIDYLNAFHSHTVIKYSPRVKKLN